MEAKNNDKCAREGESHFAETRYPVGFRWGVVINPVGMTRWIDFWCFHHPMYPRILKYLQIAEAYRAFSDAGYRPFNDIFKPLAPQK